jgi:hypothetical protein
MFAEGAVLFANFSTRQEVAFHLTLKAPMSACAGQTLSALRFSRILAKDADVAILDANWVIDRRAPCAVPG